MMKRLLPFFIIILCIVGCSKSDKNWITWSGGKEIPGNGGTVIWKPLKDDVRLFPTINTSFVSYYNSDEELVKTEELQGAHGDWYDIVTSENSISVSLSENVTGYQRVMQISFEDGVVKGGHSISIKQEFK